MQELTIAKQEIDMGKEKEGRFGGEKWVDWEGGEGEMAGNKKWEGQDGTEGMGGKCYHHQMHSFIQKAIRKRFESLGRTKPHNRNENMMEEVLCGRLGSPCKWKYIETAPLCANHLGLAVNLKIIWCSQKAVGWLGTQSLLPQIWVHFASSAGSFHRCVPETKKAGGELIVDRWQRCGSCPAECELNSQPADHGSLLQRGVVECSWATYRGVKWKSVIIRSENRCAVFRSNLYSASGAE